MNTKHLQYLIEIQKCGSVNKAAKKCFITQSHLSRILQNVEKEVGFDIFMRVGNSLEVTKGGVLFFESITKIVNDCLAIENIPRHIIPSDDLSIACSPSALLTQTFFDFTHAFPVEYSHDVYREAGLKQLMELIAGRSARLGFLVMSMQSFDKYQKLAEPYNLKLTPVKNNLVFHVVMHQSHPLTANTFISVKDLANYPVVVDVDVDFEDTLKWLKQKDFQQILSVASRGTLIDALKKGRYITTQIKSDDANLADFGLVQYPISDLASYMMICLIEPLHIELRPREQKYIEYTNKRIRNFFGSRVICKM